MNGLPSGAIERLQNRAILKDWLKEPTKRDHYLLERLNNQESLAESLAFGLRNMADGIDPTDLAQRHQCPLPAGLAIILEKMINNRYLEEHNGRFRISSFGALFADSVMREILCA